MEHEINWKKVMYGLVLLYFVACISVSFNYGQKLARKDFCANQGIDYIPVKQYGLWTCMTPEQIELEMDKNKLTDTDKIGTGGLHGVQYIPVQ